MKVCVVLLLTIRSRPSKDCSRTSEPTRTIRRSLLLLSVWKRRDGEEESLRFEVVVEDDAVIFQPTKTNNNKEWCNSLLSVSSSFYVCFCVVVWLLFVNEATNWRKFGSPDIQGRSAIPFNKCTKFEVERILGLARWFGLFLLPRGECWKNVAAHQQDIKRHSYTTYHITK